MPTKIKLVRELEFPEKGRVLYGTPFGTQEFTNVLAKAGPSEEGSFDELPRKDWYQNREFDGWVAWRSMEHQVTVAGEARGGEFEGGNLKITLLNSEGKAMLPDITNHPVPNEFTTRFFVGFAPQVEAAPRMGWELYNPLEAMVSVGYLSGILPSEFAGAEGGSNAILATFKKAENRRGWVARAYASEGSGTWPTLLVRREWSLLDVNLIEENQKQAGSDLRLRPFEIPTRLLLKR